MKLPLFQIDAFTDQLFGGNPAAVCPLQAWLSDEQMQAIARENNLAETGFFIPLQEQHFQLRWFTPDYEIDLCGHGTLAAAYILFECMNYSHDVIYFQTLSGEL